MISSTNRSLQNGSSLSPVVPSQPQSPDKSADPFIARYGSYLWSLFKISSNPVRLVIPPAFYRMDRRMASLRIRRCWTSLPILLLSGINFAFHFYSGSFSPGDFQCNLDLQSLQFILSGHRSPQSFSVFLASFSPASPVHYSPSDSPHFPTLRGRMGLYDSSAQGHGRRIQTAARAIWYSKPKNERKISWDLKFQAFPPDLLENSLNTMADACLDLRIDHSWIRFLRSS